MFAFQSVGWLRGCYNHHGRERRDRQCDQHFDQGQASLAPARRGYFSMREGRANHLRSIPIAYI
ncbi:MAG TPA: hypothetical protein PKV67_15750, partial [Hyphomonas sp.]|nr:hypothetical protein [Hyphomonas sp.]